jgi:hypothetical protein
MWLMLMVAAHIGLAVSPAHCFEPCTAQFTLTVDNVEAVKELCLNLDGDTYSTGSCWGSLRRTMVVQIKNIPAGDYQAWVAFRRPDGTVDRSQSHPLTVLPKH